VIQLSARHKSDDHLWFSFFHEAARIHLHDKTSVFVDGTGRGGADLEVEANDWAANALVPRPAWERFAEASSSSETAVRAFAEEQAIAPGIVLGRLQHERHLRRNTRLNRLKVRYKWRDD